MATDISTSGARRLACAILLQAARDAQRGDVGARSWLAGDGAVWAEAMGIATPEVIQMWVRNLHG